MDIRKLNAEELPAFISLLKIFKTVFEQQSELPEPGHLAALLARKDFAVFAAFENDEVRGGLSLYVLPGYYGLRPSAYLYDLGVAPAFQGRGLGQALVEACCRYCEEQDYSELFVQAEAQDEEVLRFYRKTRLKQELPALQFSCRF